MKIFKIEKMKYLKNTFKLFFEKNNSLLVLADTVVKFDLKIGTDVSEDSYKKIVFYDKSNRIISDALFLVSRRSYSSKKLQEKLVRKGYGYEEAIKAVKRLEELNYVNDEKFANIYAASLLQKGKGEFIIRSELEKQNIEKNLIDDILKSIKMEVEPYERIIEILKIKFKNFNKKNKNEITRVARFFLRRGFSSEDVAKAFRNYKNIFLD